MITLADSVLGKISRWASECPDSTALTDGTRAFSYGELNAQADRFVAYLRELGVAGGDTVGLCIERSLEWLVAALGTMKAGAAYVPLDPSWPDSRVKFALSDSGAIVFVGPSERFDRFNLRIRHVDPFEEAGAIAARQRASATAIQPESLACIVYTSDSTGVPKGVEITHANLNHLVAWHCKAFSLTSHDRTSHLAGLGFDAAVWEIWPSLCAGATLCLAGDSVRLSSAGQPIVPMQSVTDEVEIKLMRIVHDLLDGRSIGEHDNLFLSGGHSLFGMQLLTRVRTTFGVDLSLQQLFDAATVHGLASVIQVNHWTHQKENLNRTREVCDAPASCCSSSVTTTPVTHDADNAPPDLAISSPHTEYVRRADSGGIDSVPLSADEMGKVLKGDIDHTSGAFALNREGTRTPIFWVHNPVISLAKALGGDQPFFIFTLTAFDIAELGQKPSFRDLAARFLTKILAVQPDGNFILGGLCIGSVLVYEIAQQMRTLGLEAKLLILLDAPTQPYLKSSASLRAKFGHPSHSLKRAMRVGLGQTVLNLQKRLLKSIPFSLRSRIFSPNWEMVHEMIVKAAFVYYPQPYDGEVLLLLSSNAPRHLDFLPGWQAVVGAKLTVAYVNGHHREFITPHNVRAIAETVNQYLPDSARASSCAREIVRGSSGPFRKDNGDRSFAREA